MKRMWSGVLATAVAGSAYAQSPVIQPRLAEIQPAKFSVPLCPLKPEGKVQKGVDALRKSYDAKADKAGMLKQAHDLILEGITEAQGNTAPGWYYLARVYLMQGDIGGVDSAFTRAQKLQPQCELDIDQIRQNNWAQLAKPAFDLQQQNKIDEALALFRDAHRVFYKLPHVAANMGVLFANSGRDDSAAVYFGKAFEIAEEAAKTDTSLIADRNSNALNLAIMYMRLGKNAEAVPVLRKYRAWDPGNLDARKSLSQAFRGAGMADSADALDNAMIAEMSSQNLDSLEVGDLMAIGVSAFNAQKYDQAAAAFGKAAARNPFSRDAIYNLSNAYLALKDNEKLVESASKLVAIEPMNEDVYRLIGQGQRALKRDEEVLKAAEKLVGLQVNIEMTGFAIGRNNAKLEGTATGREPTDAQGKAIPKGPVTLVVEFVTTAGQVVDTKEVAIPKVETGSTHKLSVEGKGNDIAGWRYRPK
jgi:tetratricopeptide (TPR) repeat protein